jgi:hypothetical protein
VDALGSVATDVPGHLAAAHGEANEGGVPHVKHRQQFAVDEDHRAAGTVVFEVEDLIIVSCEPGHVRNLTHN